jgi:NADH-quinone oxidoreductase subunit N
MISVNYPDLLRFVWPETIIVVAALCVLTVDLMFLRASESRLRSSVGAALSLIGCAAAIVWIVLTPQTVNVLDGTLVLTPLVQRVQVVLLVLTMFTIVTFSRSRFTRHVCEYLALILLATVSMMLLVSTQNLLVIFLSLEMLSLSLYILTAFNKRSVRSSEAALKYFLFGGISAAFLLFGFSLLYGLSNSTNLLTITANVHGSPFDPLLIVAMVMVLVGLGFKVAAAPFHFWAPDVYQGAPVSAAALIASSSKVAGFFVLYQIMVVGLAGAEGSTVWHGYSAGWVPVVAIVAAVSMMVGNLAAIVQSSVRRLLAYSAVAHAGYMLLGVLSNTEQSFSALLYYVTTYGLTVLGAFGVIAMVEEATGGDMISDFAGFSRRAPVPSFCMLIFLLSLAGIPPFAGFFAKFFLFSSVLISTPAFLWLVILAIAMSVVSLYYYLKVLKSIYVAGPHVEAKPIDRMYFREAVLCVVAFGVVLFGCVPDLLLRWF